MPGALRWLCGPATLPERKSRAAQPTTVSGWEMISAQYLGDETVLPPNSHPPAVQPRIMLSRHARMWEYCYWELDVHHLKLPMES
jgi:hypothetical protein